MTNTFILRTRAVALFLFPILLFAQAQVEMPTVSTLGGKYNAGFPLSISSATPNARFYYTLDGNEPTENATLYTSLIPIEKNTTLRIKGFAAGMIPSKTATHSYFINTTHTFPIVALSFKKSDFFNDTTGIYVQYNNGLEVPANIELFEQGPKTAAFNQMVGVQIQGSTSTQLPQKSLEIKASGAYTAIPYKVFPEQPFTSYKRFVLRNGGQDWGITLFRDELVASLGLKTTDLNNIIRKPDLLMQDFRPSVVYLNGEYWGIHGIRERMNRFYVEQHFNLKSADYDMVENWGTETNNGDSLAFLSFYNSLANRNFADNAAFEQLKTELDVSNFLDYNVFNVFIDNTDWPSNNVRCFKPKLGGKWRFISYDHDFSFGLFQLNGGWNTGDATPNSLARLFNAATYDWPNGAFGTFLFRKCMENANFKRDFINRMADMMNTVFKPSRISQKIDGFKTEYQPEIARHAARWGAPVDIVWNKSIDKMRSFGNLRASEVMNHIRQQFPDVTGTTAITLSVIPANGGSVNFSTLNLTPSVMPFTGTYFTGVDIPVTAVAATGYVFRGWSDASLGNSPTINVRLSGAKNLSAIFEPIDNNPCTTDIEKPVLQNCPSNMVVPTTQTCAVATWNAPTATDNCTQVPSVWSNYPSGFCFPVGTTSVIYMAADGRANTVTCSFAVQVNQQATGGGVCKKYTVADVNNFCGCAPQQWSPYSILIDNPNNCLGTRLTAQNVSFQQNADGTATLNGTFRDSIWTSVLVDIQLSGGTTTPPQGALYRSFCMQSQPVSATSGWVYYPQMTGVFKVGSNSPLPITLNGTPFQVGIGANQQRIGLLGASGKFLISGAAAGQFNFVLDTEQVVPCNGTGDPCSADTQPPVWLNCPQNQVLITNQTCATATWTAPTATDNCTTPPSVNSNFSSGGCFPIGITTVIYTSTDAQNNSATCRFNINVQNSAASAADIALSLVVNPSTYTKFTVLTAQLVAKNVGNTPFSSAKIRFSYPSGTVNGGNPTPSVGTWSSYCGSTECNEWTLPSLAVGATATLNMPLYVINSATTINAVAQLLASTPTDLSTANNQTNLLVQPTLAPVASAFQKATQYLPVVIQRISPNPTADDEITVDLESINDNKVVFEFFNSLGKIVKTESRKLEKGINKLLFDVQGFESGLYFIVPTTQIGKHVPTKFVKM